MPPRPAQARRLLVDKKHEDLLSSLASAPSLSLFKSEALAYISLYTQVTCGADKSLLRQQIRDKQLVLLLCAATARAVQLLQEQCSDLAAAGGQLPAAPGLSETAFVSINLICTFLHNTLFEGAKVWRYEYEKESRAAAPPEIINARRQMEQELAQSGLLRALAAACPVLTNHLKQHRQQQQQQTPAAISSTAAAYLLGISRLVLQIWRIFPMAMAGSSPMSDSSMLAPTVLPVAGLAMEVLCSSSTDLIAARRIASGSPSSGIDVDSQGRGMRVNTAERQEPRDCPMLAAFHSVAIFTAAAAADYDTPTLLGDDTVLKLLLVDLGCVAEAQHNKHKGIPPAPAAAQGRAASRSSSSSRGKGPQQKSSKQTSGQQQQQSLVPPYHQQLLLALGVCPSTAALRSQQYIAEAMGGDATAVSAAGSLINAFGTRSGYEQPQSSAAELMQQSHGSAAGSSGSSSGAAARQPASGADSADITEASSSRTDVHILRSSTKPADASLLPAGLLQPVLLTLLELQVLAPGLLVMCNGIQVMQLLHGTLAHELDAAAAANIVQPLLQLLAPAVSAMFQDVTGPKSQQAAVDANELQGVRHSTKVFHELVVTLSVQVARPQLLSMLQEQPQLTLTALEAALRGAAVGDPGGLADLAKQSAAEAGDELIKPRVPIHRHSACFATHLLDVCGSYMAALSTQSAATGSGHNSTETTSSSRGSTTKCSQLLSVAVTCCKALSNAKSASGCGDEDAAMLLDAVRVCIDVSQQAVPSAAAVAAGSCSDPPDFTGSSTARGSSSSSSITSSCAAATGGDPWCGTVLAARAIQLAGQVLAAQAAVQPAEADPVSTGKANAEQQLVFLQLLRELQSGLTSLGNHLSKTAAEVGIPGESAAAGIADADTAAGAAVGLRSPTLQQLLKQHAAVMQGLQAALDVYTATWIDGSDGESADTSSASGGPAGAAAAGPSWMWGLGQVVGPVLARQLQDFGAAVCGQLPLPHCCNNFLCLNMGQGSELQLVGGKSCICSGCKTARYCGKECQLAHWKAHKLVCKRIKAAATVTG